MSSLAVNEPLQQQAAEDFQQDVWAWLAPLIAFGVGAGAAEATQQIIKRTTGKKLSLWARLAVDASAGAAAWLAEAGRRMTPAQRERQQVDFNLAKSIRGANWPSDLREICGIAFDQADVKAMAFLGLPPESIEISSAELEAVIAQRQQKIRQQYTGATQEVMLAGYNGFANRVRQLQRRQNALN